MDELTPQKLNKFLSEFLITVSRTISTYFQDVSFYSIYFCLLTAFLLDNLDVKYFTRKPLQCNSRIMERLDRALVSLERN